MYWRIHRRFDDSALAVTIDPNCVAGRIKDIRRRGIWQWTNRQTRLPKSVRSCINACVKLNRPFVVGDTGFDFLPIEASRVHGLLSDVWKHRNKLDQSETFAGFRALLESNGSVKHKNYKITTEAEIVPMIQDCYLDLLVSLSRDGYLPNKTSRFATGGTGTAIVWQDGSLWHEETATHRLVAARIVGLKSGFPLRIVAVHRGWLTDRGLNGSGDLHRLSAALQSLRGVLP